MPGPLSPKAIACGALVVILGYVICMVLMAAVIAISSPSGGLIAVGVFALLTSCAAGFTGACFAPTNRVLNGTLAGFLGGGLLLLALAYLGPPTPDFAFLGPLLTITILAAIGAIVANRFGSGFEPEV